MIEITREDDKVFITADSYLEIFESPDICDLFKEILISKIPPIELGRCHNCSSTIIEPFGITRIEAAPLEIYVS